MARKINQESDSIANTCNQKLPPDRNAEIAELAYYKAESRGFEPGYDIEDWLEAEQEYQSIH